MPYQAILEADLIGRIRSWVVRIWLVLMAFQAFFTVAGALTEEEAIASEAIAGLLGTFPLVWSVFVIIISSSAVSSEAGVVADSVLSKAVTRYEYILAKFSSRLFTVIGLYLIVVLPAVFIISNNTDDALSNAGLTWGVTLIGLFLVLLTSLAVTFSTLFNRTMVAVVIVWFLWYGAGIILALVGAEYLSPVTIIETLPAMLQGDYDSADQWRTLVGFSLPSIGSILVAIVYFSRKDL
jgi:ABC-2 type transport system permease protein